MPVTSISMTAGPTRKKPRAGDRKIIKGVEHIRIPATVKTGPYRGSHIVSNGRACFEWVPAKEQQGGAA